MNNLKGQCHEIFCFRFFSWITFPQAPENNTRVISNFFKNSGRYCHRCQWHWWQIAAGNNDTGGKFATGMNDTSSKFCHQFCLCCWHRWQIFHRCHWHRWQISKKFETVLLEYSGAGGNWFMKRTRSKKSWHCPFNILVSILYNRSSRKT